jgi:hypothetical protein
VAKYIGKSLIWSKATNTYVSSNNIISTNSNIQRIFVLKTSFKLTALKRAEFFIDPYDREHAQNVNRVKK